MPILSSQNNSTNTFTCQSQVMSIYSWVHSRHSGQQWLDVHKRTVEMRIRRRCLKLPSLYHTTYSKNLENVNSDFKICYQCWCCLLAQGTDGRLDVTLWVLLRGHRDVKGQIGAKLEDSIDQNTDFYILTAMLKKYHVTRQIILTTSVKQTHTLNEMNPPK